MDRLSFFRALTSAIAVTAFVFQASVAPAQEKYPDHPVRIIVPFSPSGGTDVQARALAQQFLEGTGQTFVVENRPGASGLIGAQVTVDSPPDGYTILFTTATLAVNTTLYGKRMRFSVAKDLAPVSWITSTPLVLVVHPGVPAHAVPELVALEQKAPAFLTAGVNTIGSTSHLAAEMLKQFAHVEHVIVPYKGGGPALLGLMSGETDFLFATAPSAAPHIRNGKVRALAVTTEKRSSAFPDLPTMSSYYPGFTADNWYAMFVPAGTPEPIVAKINALILAAVKAGPVVKFMAEEGLDPVASTPQQLAELVDREIAKYAKVIKEANIKL
jgi:tripartite-type tricarboxylate transporter receptor subunit TctC